MRLVIAVAAVALLAVVPSAQASCHYCLDAVAESCGSADVGGCRSSVAYFALHADDFAMHQVEHAVELVCGEANCT